MIRIGLSSTALMTFGARDVIAAAAAAGIDAIEWAGGIHVPHDDAAACGAAMIDTLRAGLTTASYSALYRAGTGGESGLHFEAVLDAASGLQAPILRIFIGGASAICGQEGSRELLVNEARRLGDLAAKRGITLCLSLGRNTCMDRYASALDLIARIDHPFVRMAWEALPGVPAEACSGALEAAGVRVAMLLVRSVDRGGAAGRLEEQEENWRRRLRAFKKAEVDPKMAQFVVIAAIRESAPDSLTDILPSLCEDSALLRRLIAEQS